ncbi:hypothetical protein [Chryseobacterium indoltheticum]|uniref:hypothetical protein n=1 Tax=Chryseobacterium indoltheticum TaxID=254 RepID=UPI003F493706
MGRGNKSMCTHTHTHTRARARARARAKGEKRATKKHAQKCSPSAETDARALN